MRSFSSLVLSLMGKKNHRPQTHRVTPLASHRSCFQLAQARIWRELFLEWDLSSCLCLLPHLNELNLQT